MPEREFTEKELYFIVRHEVEHYRNHDLWLKLLFEIISSVYWWNPFVYILREGFYLAVEISDDIRTVITLCPQDKISYAECLVHAAIEFIENPNRQGLAFYHKKGKLQIRIHTILNYKHSPKKKIFSMILNLCVIISTAAICFIFVPEAYQARANAVESFEIDESDYLIETENGYALYVDGVYIDTLTELPSKLKIKIYER